MENMTTRGERAMENTSASIAQSLEVEVRIHQSRLSLFMNPEIATAIQTHGRERAAEGKITIFSFSPADYHTYILPLMEFEAAEYLQKRSPRLVEFLGERVSAGIEREAILADAAHRWRIVDLGFLNLVALTLDFIIQPSKRRTSCRNQTRSASAMIQPNP